MAPDYIFEPSPEAVLNRVLYGFTEVQVLQAIYESLASEHSARMVAMRNATDAAGELVDDLTLDLQQGTAVGHHQRTDGHHRRHRRAGKCGSRLRFAAKKTISQEVLCV